MNPPISDHDGLTADERAAARAFVARCEVRLSTFHRIAVGMLSGAGLLVVLPVVARDSVTGVLRSLAVGDVTTADVALGVGVVVGSERKQALEDFSGGTIASGARVLLAVAVYLGDTRLIDNVVVDV